MGYLVKLVDILACLGERRRPIRCLPNIKSLEESFRIVFSDLVNLDQSLIFQVKDSAWEGLFIDLSSGAALRDRRYCKRNCGQEGKSELFGKTACFFE